VIAMSAAGLVMLAVVAVLWARVAEPPAVFR
jgi:hypothetical protein